MVISLAEATVATPTIGAAASTAAGGFSVRDLKNFLTFGAAEPELEVSAVALTDLNEVTPHLPTIPADLAATGLLHCSFIILSKGFPDFPPGPFLE